jgi:hypothetical protein
MSRDGGLPPGVNDSDLPGNSAKDLKAEDAQNTWDGNPNIAEAWVRAHYDGDPQIAIEDVANILFHGASPIDLLQELLNTYIDEVVNG